MNKNIVKTEQYSEHKIRLYPELHPLIDDERVMARTVTFQVTDDCQLRCKYCYEVNKAHNYMPIEIGKKFVDLLFNDELNNGYINSTISPFIILEFIGGEPLMAINIIDEIMDYFIEKAFELEHPWATRYIISLCSNGVAYFDKDVQKFLNKHQNHISLNITIDGNKELHDMCRVFPNGAPSYDLAVAAAMDWINEKKRYMGSKITIAPNNIDYLPDALNHMIDLGYTEINANCVFEEGWELVHAQKLYQYMKEFGDMVLSRNKDNEIYCSLYEEELFTPKDINDLNTHCGGTGSMMLSCDPKGFLFPCIRYMETSLGCTQKPIIIGDVDSGIYKTNEQVKTKEILESVTRRTQSDDRCFYCPIANGCADCAAYNYQLNGTVHSKATAICIMHRARALANVYYWNKYYQKNNINKHMICYVPEDWAIPIIGKEEYDMLINLAGARGTNPYEEEFRRGCEQYEFINK